MPGLGWKIWSWNADANQANGTYLFLSRAAADAYGERIFSAGPPTREGYSNFEIEILDVMEEPSRVTRAPLD